MLLNLLIKMHICLLFLRLLTLSYWIFLLFKFKVFLLVNKSLIMKINPSLVWILCWLAGFFQNGVVFLVFEFNFLGVRAAAGYFIFIFSLNVLGVLNFELRLVNSSALHYVCLAAFESYAFLIFKLFVFVSHWLYWCQDHFTEKVFIILVSRWIRL